MATGTLLKPLALLGVAAALLLIASASAQITETKLTASDGAAFDRFGEGVAISGDTAVVGARDDDDNGTDSGSAYVFVRSGTTAIAGGGDPVKIASAEDSLAAGDAARASGQFKVAAAHYKDAVAKAETA